MEVLETPTLGRRRLTDVHLESIRVTFDTVLNQHGNFPPESKPTSVVKNGCMTHLFNRNKQSAYNQFICRAGLQLTEFVRQLRSETELAKRSNKSLEIPSNGSVGNTPLGAVQNIDFDVKVKARIIHDLSYPPGESVNDNTNLDFNVEVPYGADALTKRTLDVVVVFPELQWVIPGYINGAFRHIPIEVDVVGNFAGTIHELGVLIFHLCCPSGWKNSPSFYWIAGTAITYQYSNSPPEWHLQPAIARIDFDAKSWRDAHATIGPNIGSRLSKAHIAFRRANLDILCPGGCNDKKFTSWFTRGRALGRDWDLSTLTISMLKERRKMQCAE
ncbi:hypothetical protein PHMEG_00017318 [Phytophthora megakarya]|uniref:Uncharacterized protein n=1 Tax=Phytophthora megakarya TaxID=4795 RepID=A0A225VX28_9STRA|nr:hypothetical protein PHMEG_00017318 [Phytophthora megakarya]